MERSAHLALMAALDNGSNMFGPLRADIRARLFAVADNPTSDTWTDANGIILRAQGLVTLWQALGWHTDYAVTSGPAFGRGETPHWPPHMLPTSAQIVRAVIAELKAAIVVHDRSAMNDHLTRYHLSNGWFIDGDRLTSARPRREHKYSAFEPGGHPSGCAALRDTDSSLARLLARLNERHNAAITDVAE